MKFKIMGILFGLFVALATLKLADIIIFNNPEIINRPQEPRIENWDLAPEIQKSTFQTSSYNKAKIIELVESDKKKYAHIKGKNKVREEYKKSFTKDNQNFILNIKGITELDEVIYNQEYKFDTNLRRPTKTSDNLNNDFAMVFLGCSYTFGEGLEDHETYPWIFSEKYPRTKVYNLGQRALGPTEILYGLQNNDPRFQIDAKKIILIYGFMSDHLNRNSCSYRCAAEQPWILEKPRYILEDNNLKYVGTQGEYYQNSYIYKFASLFNSLVKGPLFFSVFDDDEAIKLHFRILSEIKKEFQKKHHVIDSYQVYLDTNPALLINRMEKINNNKDFGPIVVPFFNIKTDLNLGPWDFKIPADRHPNHASNYVVAETVSMRIMQDYPQLLKTK